jgi:hypothetical protein
MNPFWQLVRRRLGSHSRIPLGPRDSVAIHSILGITYQDRVENVPYSNKNEVMYAARVIIHYVFPNEKVSLQPLHISVCWVVSYDSYEGRRPLRGALIGQLRTPFPRFRSSASGTLFRIWHARGHAATLKEWSRAKRHIAVFGASLSPEQKTYQPSVANNTALRHEDDIGVVTVHRRHLHHGLQNQRHAAAGSQ